MPDVPSPLFIGKRITIDRSTRRETQSTYVAVYLDGAGRPAKGSTGAMRLEDLIEQLKLVGKARRPFTFDPPKGVYPRRDEICSYEALSYDDFNKAQVLLGLI